MPILPTVTDEEKIRIRSHMGYPQVRAAAGFALGFPATIEVSFLIEQAMDEVKPEALTELRRILDVLDAIEGQMVDDHELLAVDAVGEIKLRGDEQERLDRRYDRWLAKLENLLVVPRNPHDKRKQLGGINRQVVGTL